MPVFRWFRRLVVAIEALHDTIAELVTIQQEAGPALERLEALELSRHQFEAEVAGTLLKAEGKLKAASNAEARERQLKKSYESQLDSIDPEGEEVPAHRGGPLLDLDAERSEAQRLQPVRLGLAPNNKAAAVRAKFGL